MSKEDLKAGFKKAKIITKRFAKTFYLASFSLPKEERFACYVIYAICRISDESVDNQRLKNQEKALKMIRKRIETAYAQEPLNDTLLISFRFIINRYSIPKIYFHWLLEGSAMDIMQKRYQNFAQLYKYCFRVAGVVGLIILKILSTKNPKINLYAVNLGIAMQLTNILRDIKEDYQRGRIYLHLQELNNYGVREEDIALKKKNEGFKRLIEFQIQRCKTYYQNALEGISYINAWRGRLLVVLMLRMYYEILKEIEKNPFIILEKRVSISFLRKLKIILGVIFKKGLSTYAF